MINKSISLFGRELFNFRVERNRLGEFSYSFVNGDEFSDDGKYLDLYLKNPVLSTIVNLRADIYSQMKIRHFKNDKEVENSPYVKLLSQPNYFQSKEDFFYQQMVFLSVSGTDLIYQIKAFKNDIPKSIYNLIPSEIDFKDVNKISKFITTKQDFNAFGEQKIIYTLDDQEYKIKVSELIPTYDLANGLVKNSFMSSPSRVKAIAKLLNNIERNLHSKGINLDMSAKYLAKNESNGNEAQIQDADRNSIINSIAKNSLVITNQANVDIKHLVSDMKRLYLDEQFADDANKCLLAFGMNKHILNYLTKDSGLGNSGELITQSMISYIQNSIQNTADNTMNSLSSQWGLLDNNEKLVASYDHLPVMQSIVIDKIANFKTMQEVIKLAIENGTMTNDEAKKMSDEFKNKIGL
jgi:hypothetical protein